MAESSTDIHRLFLRLRKEGTDTKKLTDWHGMSLGAILLGTESGACFIIEPVAGKHSLVTRLSEASPFYDEYRLPYSEVMVQRPGNPDQNLEVGEPFNIYGLPRKGTIFDPDSIYTTTPLVEIKFLES